MLWIVFNYCYYATFVLVPIIVFVLFTNDDNFHSRGGILYLAKFLFGKRKIAKKQKRLQQSLLFEDHNCLEDAKWIPEETQSDRLSFSATDQNGNQLSIELTLRSNHLVETYICLKIDQSLYILPNKYDSLVEEHPIWTRSTPSYQWKCPWLNIEILEPFKRCRVTFNGFLMDVSPTKYGNVEHFKMNLIWNCSSKPNISFLDDDLNLLTKCLAKTTWRDGRWLDLLGDEKGYLQFGALKGQISCEKFMTEVNMASVKRRYWGTLESVALKKYVRVFAATENGRLLHFGMKSLKNGCQELKFGHVLTLNGCVHPIQDSDVSLRLIGQNVSSECTIHLKVNNKLMKLVLTTQKRITLLNDSLHGFKHHICPSECLVDFYRGFAIIDQWHSFKGRGIEAPFPILKGLQHEYIPNIIVTPIDSPEARILELTGGKGHALALMKNLEDHEILIPDGFIVTTHAYQKQIENNFNLRKSLCLLEDIVLGREKGNIENACEITVGLFQEQTITPSVATTICDELVKFRRKHDDKIIPYLRWAVRSSAIGEDSEEYSSAGQNETYLGCQTDKDVLRKICYCWASLYTYQSVMYRRQHGLPIQISMAVVIQKMVPAESAGVLFTSHPSTSSPATMLVTSNFGLGETVVSGESDPDTIILSKTFDGNVTFESFSLGSKTCSMVMSRYGVLKKGVSDVKTNDLSISVEHVVKLGRIGVKLETAFGGPRDIEWALFKGQLYILQSRPITTLNQWTDYELLHEFDTPHLSNDIFYTRANIGEVCPFALTPLTASTIVEYLEKAYQVQMFQKYDPYVHISILLSHNYSMIELLAGLYARPKKDIDVSSRMVDLAIFGHPVLNEEINNKAIERYGLYSNYNKLKEILDLVKHLWQVSRTVREVVELADNVNIKIDKKDNLTDVYRKIDGYLKTIFIEVSLRHMIVTMICIAYQTFAMISLLGKETELTIDHYSDLALILSSCNDVVSAEIPIKLQKIAEVLKTSNLAEEFILVNKENGIDWLKEKSKEAYELLQEFLKNHGHRILGEMELSINPWGQDPSQVVEMIQTNCKTDVSNFKKAIDHNKDVVKDLVSPKKQSTRVILRYLIKKNRKAVANRETSKSCLVKATNKIRIAYKTLARKMASQGLIPSDNLVFYLTHFEVWQILHGKNLNLISKAMKRQRLYSTWNKLKFPEIIYGIPKPEVEVEPNYGDIDSDIICKGTPVCLGEITARACVITSLDEISNLKEGDILITKSTDIGWSPYFPMLAGIVTELGGLVSHGAVVAREYGLPCIVGTKKATRMFKTGSKIHLSGKNGTIVLVSE